MFFAGMASAFGQGMEQVRAENARKAEIQAQRENAILQHLTTSDDPEIAAAALTGLTQQAQGKPLKGIRGFMGEVAGNPMLPTIRQLIAHGRKAPDQQVAAEPAGSMAMAPQAAVEPGAPPMSLQAVEGTRGPAGAPASMAAMPATQPSGRQITLPGHVFRQPGQFRMTMTPGERAYETQRGEYQARADVARGLSPTVAGQVFGHIPPVRFVPGTVLGKEDPTGRDENGQLLSQNPERPFRRMIQPDGTVVYLSAAPPPAPRPTGPEAAMHERAQEIRAEHPALSEAEAELQARTENRVATQAKAGQSAALAAAHIAEANAVTQKAQDQTPITITDERGATHIQYVTPPQRADVAPPTAGVATSAAATVPPRVGTGGIQTKPPSVTPDQVTYFADQIIRDPQNLKTITGDKALSTAVRKELASRGIDLNNLDAASRTMANTAKDIQKILPSIQAQAQELDRLGLMGPMGGRWRDLLAGKIGAGEIAGGNPQNAAKIGRFITDTGLLKTALMKAHTGARGSSQLLDEFNNMLGAGWRDLPTFTGGLKGVSDWIDVYANRIPDTRGGPPANGPVQVTDPKGGVHTFPTQAAADAFKAAAKIP